MESKKILDLAQKLYEAEKAVSKLNSGDMLKLVISDGKTNSTVFIGASADDKKSYELSTTLSKALLQYLGEVQRDLMGAVRSHSQGS